MTIIEKCIQLEISEEVKKVAQEEKQTVEFIVQGLIEGTIVIPKNSFNVQRSMLRGLGRD